MAVGLAAPRSNSARVDPHDQHHGVHGHTHNQHKATQSHRSHSHWWHFGHKKPQPQDEVVSTTQSHGHSHHHVATKTRYARHHTTDSIPAIPEHRPTTFSKRGSVTLQQHEDPRTVSRRKRIVLHAIFKC